MGLAALLVAVFWIQVAWTCRAIRGHLHERGARVTRVRWLPLKPLTDLRWGRRELLFRAWYTDSTGTPCVCLVAAPWFGQLSFEEERPAGAPTDVAPERITIGSLPWRAAAGATVACAAIGAQYWSTPYEKVSLPSSLVGPGLLLVAVFAAALQYQRPRSWPGTLAILALAPVATVVPRIVVDVGRDPTSHNLFPFELALAAFVGIVAASCGVAVGTLARRLVRRHSRA